MHSALTSDFSRQLKVHGMTPEKQQALANARVLIFGAGGLGSTAIPYLAAAGVGHLTLVDDDRVSLSNLHRQTIYAHEDIGQFKAETAAAYCRARAVGQFQAINKRLNRAELLAQVAAHAVILDCSDSRELAYQLNDAALMTGKPVIFANAAAMGGQLFTLHPGEDLPCWRCLWPESVLPGGDCNVLGVLGPVPGVFGLYQALEAIKCISGFAPALQGEVLQYDFARMTQIRLRVARRGECNHSPSRADFLAAEMPCFTGSLADAKANGWQIIDIRNPPEIAERALPIADDCVPMAELLADPERGLSVDKPTLLVCASGQRAKACTAQLRRAGYDQVFAYPSAW